MKKWWAKALGDGYYWLGIEVNGKWTPFYRVGRTGDCIRF